MCRAFQIEAGARSWPLAHDQDLRPPSLVSADSPKEKASELEPGDTVGAGALMSKPRHAPTTISLILLCVKSEQIVVAKWEKKITLQAHQPEVNAFLVICRAESETLGTFRKAWLRGGAHGRAFKKLRERGVKMSASDIVAHRSGGFVRGKALHQDKTASIRTCGGSDRPFYVIRVTHQGTYDGTFEPMPHRGLRARGFGLLKTDPVHFQEFVQRHLEWKSRIKSPFVSVALNVELALLFYELYKARKYCGIKIHIIRTVGPEWKHEKQPMWRVNHLVQQLGLDSRPVYDAECLIENEIPRSAIVRTFTHPKQIPKKWIKYMGTATDRSRWPRIRRRAREQMRKRMRIQKRSARPAEKRGIHPHCPDFHKVSLKS